MGYDMYWVSVPKEIEREHEEAWQVYKTLTNKRNLEQEAIKQGVEVVETVTQEQVENAYELWRLTDKAYYRLNIWGMQEARSFMSAHNLLNWQANPPAEDPGDEPEEDDSEEHEDWLEAWEEWLRWAPEDSLICAYKLCDNSGWWVTPEEIAKTLAAWDAAGQPCPPDDPGAKDFSWNAYFRGWMEWMRASMPYGGFRVY
jgi:hypothetical protein